MSELSERVQVELANIRRVLDELPASETLPTLSALEIAGVAALLHNFYNGVENILKQFARARGLGMPVGDSWHRDLVNLLATEEIVSEQTANQLRRYLAFRHFFSHGYAVDLQPAQMQLLVKDVEAVYGQFSCDIESAL